MNPANNSQHRTVFIGGLPRVGKTLVAHEIAKRVDGHITSTDWIRNAVKRSHPDRQGDLFLLQDMRSMSDAEFVELYDSGEIIRRLAKQANALWPSIVSFCSSFCDDDLVHIIEGVALMPQLVASMEHQPNEVIFVGNTDEGHIDQVLQYAEENEGTDWMTALGYSDEKKRAVARGSVLISKYFKDEAAKYNLTYVELSDFDSARTKLIQEVTEKLAS